jgi:subtilisin family serine protease
VKRALLIAAAAVLVALAGGAVGLGAGPPPVCGITSVTDRLFHCPQGSAAQPAQQQSSTTAPTTTASRQPQAATASLAQAPVARPSTTPAYVPDTIVVRFRADATTAQANAVLARIGARPLRSIGALKTTSVKVPHGTLPRALAQLRRSPAVRAATRDEVLHVLSAAPNDANYGLQWGLPLADFPAAWQRTKGSRSVVVAVLDTGVNGSVPDLAGNVRPGIDLTGTGLDDANGHGTSVAGVIAAHANNGLGGAGVCPNCTILPVKVMNADGSGDLATVAQGIVRAVDAHARVLDLSLGGTEGLDALQQAVAYAVSKGAIVVAAAGNSGRGTPFYPANYPNVVGVAGTTSHDMLYGWSERGTWVRVAAPGCNVAPLNHGGYGMFCGTSSATPLVAGLAGLAVSLRPHASNLQVIKAIEASARRIGANAGHGRIDAGKTLRALH